MSKVEFYDNGALIGSADTLAPYSVAWSSTVLGSHSLSARATDLLGAVSSLASVTVTVGASTPVDAAQFISQSVPATMVAGQSYAVSVQMKNTGTATWTAALAYKLGSQNPGDNVTWGLSRVATPGSVGNGQTATFNFTARAPTTPGPYNFQWRMLREGVTWFGDLTPNVAVNVTATNQPPTVAIATPTAGSSTAAPVGLTATASDSDGSIASVQYFEGANPISPLLTASPYPYAWSTTAGSHTLTAKAIDNLGLPTSSAPVTFTITTGPTVTVALTQPLSGASFPAGQPIPLTATATTTSGSITQVEFLDGTAVVATATSATATFTASWLNASIGSHSLTARATTSSGIVKTSSPAVSITVSNPPPTQAVEVQYQYDALGRLVHVLYGNGSEVVYAYDAAGNRTIQSQTLK